MSDRLVALLIFGFFGCLVAFVWIELGPEAAGANFYYSSLESLTLFSAYKIIKFFYNKGKPKHQVPDSRQPIQ